MFKKRFGMTPSEWRQQNLASQPKSPLKRAGMVALWLCLCGLLLAPLRVPAAAEGVSQTAPAAAAKPEAHFQVEKYVVTGNSVLTPEQISNALTNVPEAFGTNVTFAYVRKLLGELQTAYRERGFVTVAVGLPPQKLTNETLKIKVTEGRLANIQVQGNDWFSTPNVLAALPSLETNMLLNSHVFQRELDQANANRDRQIYPVIGPGLEPGTSELTLKVKDRFPLHARVEYNNTGTPGTPDDRVAFNTQYGNLWQLEHQVGLQYSFSPLGYASKNDYYGSPFDLPAVANYSAYYRMPLGKLESVQNQIDNSNGRFGYNETTHQFQLPPPSGRPEVTFYVSRSRSDAGVHLGLPTNVVSTPLLSIISQDAGQNITLNEGVGGKVSWPLPAMGRLTSAFSLGLDFKHYSMASFNSNNFYASTYVTNTDGSVSNISTAVNSPQTPYYTDLYYLPLNVGFNGSVPDEFGQTFFNAQANFNLAVFDSSFRSGTNVIHGGMAQVIPGGTRLHDDYISLQLGADRSQRLYHDWTVKLHADGQWADGALFSNEQYAMGGLAGVRGYAEGQAYGDTGWRVSVEPQTPLINLGMVDGDVPFWVRASVFLDYGQTYVLDGGYYVRAATLNGPTLGHIPGDPSELSFWGTGWSLTANIGSHLDARLSMAFPLLNTGVENGWSPEGAMRVYFAIGGQF